MKLIIVRHGETIENREGIIQGHISGHLSKRGTVQAKKLAKRLKNEKIDAIYSSDLARAANTTKEILKFHKNIPVIYTKDLRERKYGDFEGKNKKAIKWDENEKDEGYLESHGAEPLNDLYDRAKKIVDKIFHTHKKDCVLISGHGTFNRTLICAITNKKPRDIKTMSRLDNTSVNIFEIDENKKHKIHLLNCTKHLE